MEIFSDKNGEKAIQITSLENTLNNKIFKSFNNFIKEYKDIKLSDDYKSIDDSFKVFIIMDTDDCTEAQKIDYKTKEMFKNHWLYKYIVPIYNSPELETVLTKAKVPFKKTGDKRKKEYVKLFPTDIKYNKSDELQIKELLEKLKKINSTNLDLFLDFCLKNI